MIDVHDTPWCSHVDTPCCFHVGTPCRSHVGTPCRSHVGTPCHSHVNTPCCSHVGVPGYSHVITPCCSHVGTPCCSCDGTPCRVFVSFTTFNDTVDLYWKFRGYAVGFKSYTLIGQRYTSDQQCCYTITTNASASIMFYAATVPTNYVVLLNDNLCFPYRPTL